jgi:6-pyruvoyltetrahydropterin/6-carboxytetrahydropterin synthase
MHKVHRYHDICAGHRVTGHESKCQHLHGHNYRVHFTCMADNLDDVGRVIDFSVVKEKLCLWIEDNWDHKFLHWEHDPVIAAMVPSCGPPGNNEARRAFEIFYESMVKLPFNPTAENMAQYLVDVIGPQQLAGTGVVLTEVLIEETAKCHASYGV